MENQEKKTRNNFFKGTPVLIITIVVIGVGVWFYNYSTLKTKCERQVSFVPAVGKTEGIFGHPAEDSYFSWSVSKFESREAAVKGCMRSKKDN